MITLEAKFGDVRLQFLLIQKPYFIQFKLDFLHSAKQS